MARLGGNRCGVAAAALAAVLTACPPAQRGTLTGSVSIDGSSTVFPITQAVAEEFRREEGKIEISVGVSGTGGGIEKFCNGEIDVADASRAIKDEERAACRKGGVDFVEIEVAKDGLSVVVNPENDWIDCITTAELARVWRPGSEVRRWRQIRAGFPDRPLALYGPGTDSGTFDYFTDTIVGEEGASRSDYTASEDDNVLIQGVAGDENAIGYFGFAFYSQNRDVLKVVAVDGGDGCVTPSLETINRGTYAPLSRPLYIYVARDAAVRREVRAFLDFYLANVSALVRDVGYVPLADDAMIAQTAAWEEFRG